ncbi:MAG TPA: PQQ-dependent sugar dehydrogenase [Actinomycetota bacterium]|nr:PQQ-dependent sugar dehydrogenase [Actinomycetota bacterium]
MAGRFSILVLFLTLPLTLFPAPSQAAVGRESVVPCPESRQPCWPAAFAISPDGTTIFYGERFTGRIVRVDVATGEERLWGRIRGLATDGEQGLLGLAVDPDWPSARWVYAYYTKASPLSNRVIRARRVDGSLRKQHLATIPAASYHNGGAIHFGADRRLYVVTGDTGRPGRAQRIGNRAGKVLRMNRDGSAPRTNPYEGKLTFSFGHRNSFGITHDPQTGRLWQTENGPECNDEVNRIIGGRNFGWGGSSRCPNTNASGPRPVPPRSLFASVVAPTGAAFCEGCGLGSANEGTLLMASWNDRAIRRLELTSDRKNVVDRQTIYTNPRGILGMARGPDGRVYFSDERGIYRLVP